MPESDVSSYFAHPAWEAVCAVGGHDGDRVNAQIAVSIYGASIVPDRPRLLVLLWKHNLTRELVSASRTLAITLLSEGQLDSISADTRNGRELVRIEEEGVVFDCAHPRFVRAMRDPDPIWVSFLASVAYTGLNRWLDEITDEDELNFHHRHAEHLLSGLLTETGLS